MTMRSLPQTALLSLLLAAYLPASGQTTQPPAVQPADPTAARLDAMTKLLTETQRQLEQTQQQLNQMRQELDALRTQQPTTAAAPVVPAAPPVLAEQVSRQQEQQEILEAEVKQHDQTKLESLSRYPVRVYGLLLFNAYSNAGNVDNPDLPSAALPPPDGQSNGSIGATFRQTLLGLNANGPRLFGARSSADVSIDFFGGLAYGYYGSPNGSVRLRRADVRLAWGSSGGREGSRDEVHLGIDAPLISPLSPTSYATVAEPALAWSGNLWTWAPQVQYKHTFSVSSEHPDRTLQLEGGLWDPPVVGSNADSTSRLLSPGELARTPGLLGRASIHADSQDRPFVLGIGGYNDRQRFYEGQIINMWAITSDWQIPISHRLGLEGELYRGVGLGGLGGGAYKDVVTGNNRLTGLSQTIGLNAVGGWSQLKAKLFEGTEINLIYGQDNAFARDIRSLDLSSSTYALARSARSQTVVGNLIYRPRTYLIFSPEYRRIVSWATYGPPAIANIYTLSLGYQF